MLWIFAGVLLLSILAVVGIGAALPVAHRASRTVVLHAAPAEVYAVLTGSPDWHPGVVKWEPGGDGTWTEFDSRGQGVMYRRVEAVAPRKLVTRIASSGLPYGGAWTYDLKDSGGGTELTVTEDGEVYNPLFRFVSRFIIGHTATIDAYLAAMRKKVN